MKTRSQMIEADAATLRSLAEPIAEAIAQCAVCAFGNKDILESSNTNLEVIDLLNE